MITAEQISGPLAAFLAGVVTSLHCIGMCGPLSCGICVRSGVRRSLPALGAYHALRVASYAALGLLVGGLGAAGAGRFFRPFADITPWLLLGFFVLVASGLDRRLTASALDRPLVARAVARCGKAGGMAGAGLLGAATPFLPCGPLYLMLGVALLSGSAVRGGLLLGAFAVGIIPLYLGMQIGMVGFGARMNAVELLKARRWLAVIAMVVVAARMIQPAVSDGSGLICQ